METERPSARIAYKLLTLPQWKEWQSNSLFSGVGIDITDGYIHLSTEGHVAATYDKYFKDQVKDELVLLEIDLDKVAAPTKWEEARGGALFPHVYGSIPIAAVVSAVEGFDTNHDTLEQFRTLSKE